VQPHHDEASLAIPHDLCRFLRWIAKDEQRLGRQVRRQRRDQFFQTLLGSRATAGVQPDQMMTRQHAASQRLDDVHQDHRQAQRLGQGARHLRVMHRRG